MKDLNSIMIEYQDIRGCFKRIEYRGDFYNKDEVVQKARKHKPRKMGRYASAVVTCEYSSADSPFFEHYWINLEE